jgi:hypothetical protein
MECLIDIALSILFIISQKQQHIESGFGITDGEKMTKKVQQPTQQKASKRTRHIPKVFTPDDGKKKVYCLCQVEDNGFYLVCDSKQNGCLEYYHPACVGLKEIQSREVAVKYSNCSDGMSYICPLCVEKLGRVNWYTTADAYHQSNITPGKNETVDNIVIPSQGEMKKYSSPSNKYKKDLPASPACKLNWDISMDEKGSSFDNLGYKSDNGISNEVYDTEEQDTDGDCNSEEDWEIAAEDNLPIEGHELNAEPKQVDNENANSNYPEVKLFSHEPYAQEEDYGKVNELLSDASTDNEDKDTYQSHQYKNNVSVDGQDPELMLKRNDFKENSYCQEDGMPTRHSKPDIIKVKRHHKSDSEYDTSQSEHDSDECESKQRMPVPLDTIRRLMDCPDLPKQNSFFLENPPKTSFFRISDDEWNKIRPTSEKPNTLRRPWTDIMARYMKESNDFCTFQFQRHYIAKENSRKRNTVMMFSAYGKCIFQDCSCTFELAMKREDFAEKKVMVLYNGSVKHAAGERQSRFIQNEERKTMANKFHKGHDKPSKIYQELKDSLSTNSKASGNRTGCGNQPCTIRKIASEGRQQTQMDKDIVHSLIKVKDKLIKEDNDRAMPPKYVKGFVHTISHFPLVVHMWTESQIRTWHHISHKDISYIDATGTIVKDYDDKRVLYYALVVRHPKEGNPPLPVAEMITNDQSAYSIRTFLERFRRDESLVFKGNVTIPRQLNSDYSKAIILAVLKELTQKLSMLFLPEPLKYYRGKPK